METMDRIIGAKGSGSSSSSTHIPVEAPDSLQAVQTAQVMLLCGLGPTGGPLDALKSVYLDGVPVVNSDGSNSFERLTVEWRTGTQSQSRIEGFSDIETEIGVSAEVKAGNPIVRQIDDTGANSVRVTVAVSALLKMETNGDTNPTSVEMAVDIKPLNEAYREMGRITISGKSRSKYPRSVRYTLPGTGPWQLRVRRITADSTSTNLQNTTTFESYTAITETPLRYPSYAVLALRFDARQFSSWPKIEVDWQGVLRVPSNYNAATRTYTGSWDGTFIDAVSDNPAWALYTYLTEPRYGIAQADGAYKWDLYTISKWCDEQVSDGSGGLRPRFACHLAQTQTADPWTVVQDLASVFCGRVIPCAGGLRVIADMPGKVARKHFVPANVVDGVISYADTELKDRHTSAQVKFTDPDDSYEEGVESVEDPDGYLLYGYNPVDVTAVGCYSRAQAQQQGRYILETALHETETVTFGCGAYGMDLLPGEVFTISDPSVVGDRYGGRLMAIAGTSVTLDYPVEIRSGVSYSLEVPLPDGTLERRVLTNAAGSWQQVTLVAPFSATPILGTTWVLVPIDVEPTVWRCVGNEEKDGDPFRRNITGTQHDANKWPRIDGKISLAETPASLPYDPATPPAVDSLAAEEVEYLTADNRRAVKLEIDWPVPSYGFLRGYVVSYRQAGGNWVALPEVTSNHAEIPDIQPGQWQVRVAVVSVTGVRGVATLRDVATVGATQKPTAPTLKAVGGSMRIDLTIGWPSTDCVKAELYGSSNATDSNPTKLVDLAYPTTSWSHIGLGLDVTLYYKLRVVNSWGNYSDYVTANATTIKDPSLLLQQLQGSVGRDALDDLVKTDLQTLSDSTLQLGEAQLQSLLEADRVANGTRAAQVGLASASQAIQAQADELQAEAAARLLLAAELSDAQAMLQQEQSARVTADESLARQIDTLVVKQGENTAAIQQETTARIDAVNGVLAKWSVKIVTNSAGQQVVSGISLLNGSSGSAFAVLADQFTVALPSGAAPKQVFTVGSLNGSPAVGISGNMILDGTLTAGAVSTDLAKVVLLQAKSVWATTGYIGTLSEISSNAGIMVSGRLQNAAKLEDSTAYINLDAKGSEPFLRVLDKTTSSVTVLVTADGAVNVARQVISEPDVRASGTLTVDSGWLSSGVSWSLLIDTGYSIGGDWSSAASSMFIGDATIAGGESKYGGGTGLKSVDVLVGDGLNTGAGGGYVDNRIYLRFSYTHTGNGQIHIQKVSWKLARV